MGAQELVFKVEINENTFCPKSATWYIDYKDGVGVWQNLYTYQSPDSVHYQQDDPVDPSKTVLRFGATGLKLGQQHRAAVGFCCGTTTPETPSCSCISDWAYADPTATPPVGYVPGSFRGGVDLPTIPADFTQEVEDSFRRPTTRAKRGAGNPPPQLGDGLGPNEIWNDENPISSLFNGSRIGDTGTYALLPANAAAEYEVEAADPHTFVEAKIALDSNANANLNFDLRARRFSENSVFYSYFVKIARGLQEAPATAPDIIVAVTPAPNPLPSGWVLHAAAGMIPSWAEMARFSVPATPSSAQPSCYGNPPIAANGVGSIWIRLEVSDDDLTERPNVTATLAWHNNTASECGTSGDITSCPRACTVSAEDNSINASIFNLKTGKFGYDAHEKNYRMLVWRAGSMP